MIQNLNYRDILNYLEEMKKLSLITHKDSFKSVDFTDGYLLATNFIYKKMKLISDADIAAKEKEDDRQKLIDEVLSAFDDITFTL